MVNLAQFFPLPFTCQWEHYTAGVEDDHGNTAPDWADPVDVACAWQPGATSEPLSAPTGGDLVSVDLTLFVDSGLMVDQRDRFTVDGHRFEVIGLPKDYDHGGFGDAPGRKVLELKWVG